MAAVFTASVRGRMSFWKNRIFICCKLRPSCKIKTNAERLTSSTSEVDLQTSYIYTVYMCVCVHIYLDGVLMQNIHPPWSSVSLSSNSSRISSRWRTKTDKKIKVNIKSTIYYFSCLALCISLSAPLTFHHLHCPQYSPCFTIDFFLP